MVHFKAKWSCPTSKESEVGQIKSIFNLINLIFTVAPPPEWQFKIELNVHTYLFYPLLAPPYVPLAVLTRSSDL